MTKEQIHNNRLHHIKQRAIHRNKGTLTALVELPCLITSSTPPPLPLEEELTQEHFDKVAHMIPIQLATIQVKNDKTNSSSHTELDESPRKPPGTSLPWAANTTPFFEYHPLQSCRSFNIPATLSTSKPLYIFLHLFSGRRRPSDLQTFAQSNNTHFDVCIINLDSSNNCDLLEKSTQLLHINAVIRRQIAGFHSGTPCETWSAARQKNCRKTRQDTIES
jgi:hypothetical protein